MKKEILFTLVLCAGFCLCSCVNSKSEFKNDSPYYVGLVKLKDGKYPEAKRHFAKALKKGSSYVRRRSAEELTKIGNLQERLEACENLLKLYADEDSVLLAIRQYEAAGKYAKLLALTEKLDYSTCLNEIALFRLKSMFIVNDARFLKEAENWFYFRPVSSSHCELYDFIALQPDSKMNLEDFVSLAEFRVNIFRKKYRLSYNHFKEHPEKIPLLPQFVSDIGKACLYSSNDFYKEALSFELIVKKVAKTPSEFYASFYAARFYEKAGNYFTLAENYYKKAMEAAPAAQNYDNALWYLLQLSLKRSVPKGIESVKKYCKTWSNPSYFDDFFNTLSPLLLSEGRWDSFRDLYIALDGYASGEVVSKYAYIYARLVQEKVLLLASDEDYKTQKTAALKKVVERAGKTDYYRIMAINQLEKNDVETEEILSFTAEPSDLKVDFDAESLLLGYARFGIPEKIYPEWQNIYGSGKLRFSLKNGIKIANFLRECGDEDNRYFPQSLRIAARVVSKAEEPVCRDELKALFPRNFSTFVSESCSKYALPEEIMYALIRSESFFDASINSYAGAIGLTQLMKETAADVARKLKFQNYDLTEPETNIIFGSYYLAELARRLDGNWLSAFFSYNAGITRVRRWLKSSKIAFGNRSYLPDDLFLETIPYEETREYGRKLVSATVMYGLLYYEKDIQEVIGEIVK